MTNDNKVEKFLAKQSFEDRYIVRQSNYLMTDLCACNAESEMVEVFSYHIEVAKRQQDNTENLYHLLDIGYKNLPSYILVNSVYKENEVFDSYKRYSIYCNATIEGISMDCHIEWHQHDGCSNHCFDECWIYAGKD